jgi:glycosyltransferase involved in cell wall biosynthesis
MSIVSVVIPAFNAERYISDSIESVLHQSATGAEIIVVDDGSEDSTAKIAGRYPVRLIRQSNQGVAIARNVGVNAASGSVVAFLDADDRWLPDKLQRQLPSFVDPEVGVVFGGYKVIDECGHVVGEPIETSPPSLRELIAQNRLGMLTVIARREVLLAAGGFVQAVAPCEDWDLWIRLRAMCTFAACPGVVAEYRVHSYNSSKAMHRMFRARMAVLDRAASAYGTNLSCRRAVHEGRLLAIAQYFDALREERSALRDSGRSQVGAALNTLPRDFRAWLSWPGHRLRYFATRWVQ